MQRYDLLKEEFLKKWMSGLRSFNHSSRVMSISQRKQAIKLSADAAIAATRSGATVWSRALLSRASRDNPHRLLVRRILGKYRQRCPKNAITTSKGVFRTIKCVRSLGRVNERRVCVRQVMKKRTERLRNLVPGGDSMDDDKCLIRETLDYIVYLQAQVDVMRHVTADLMSREEMK